MAKAVLTSGYRLHVVVRAVAAIGGGYVFTSLAVMALALTLPAAPADAVVSSTLIGLAVFPCAVMWAFAARSAVRAWGGLIAACLLCGAVLGLQRLLGGAA